MTQLETRPAIESPDQQQSPGRARWTLRRRWIAGIAAAAVIVAAIGFAVWNSGSSGPYGGAQVSVTTREFKIAAPATAFIAGAKTFQITNSGVTQHEFLVFHPDSSIDPTKLPLGDDGNVNEDATGVNLVSDGDNIDPGGSQTRSIDLTVPGTYVFVCNLAGHYRNGMWTVVTVK